MPQLIADIVDVYVFRRLNARVQFLLLQRRGDVALGHTWQSFHTQVALDETGLEAARRAVHALAGLETSAMYSADYINQFFDDQRDMVVLAPVLAVNVASQAPVTLGQDYQDCGWFDRDEATARLPFTGQRWAVRHIDEIMSIGEAESELYRLVLPERRPQAGGQDDAHAGANNPDDQSSRSEFVQATESGVDAISTDVPIVENEKL